MAIGTTDIVVIVVCIVVFVLLLAIILLVVSRERARHQRLREQLEQQRIERLRAEARRLSERYGRGRGRGRGGARLFFQEGEGAQRPDRPNRPPPPPPPPPCSPRRLMTMDENLLCKICYERERDVVFQPCGHCFTCGYCASLLEYEEQPCPLCRSDITSVVRINRAEGLSDDEDEPPATLRLAAAAPATAIPNAAAGATAVPVVATNPPSTPEAPAVEESRVNLLSDRTAGSVSTQC